MWAKEPWSHRPRSSASLAVLLLWAALGGGALVLLYARSHIGFSPVGVGSPPADAAAAAAPIELQLEVPATSRGAGRRRAGERVRPSPPRTRAGGEPSARRLPRPASKQKQTRQPSAKPEQDHDAGPTDPPAASARLKVDTKGLARPWGWCGGAPARVVPFTRAAPGVGTESLRNTTVVWSADTQQNLGRHLLAAERGRMVPGREHNRPFCDEKGCGTWMNFVRTDCPKIPMRPIKVYSESSTPDPKVARRVSEAEQPLVACLKDIMACGAASREAALFLPGLRTLDAQVETLVANNGTHRVDLAARGTQHRTCAVVGNAGHMRLQQYGEFIDAHDVVVRFNAQSIKGYSANVGVKTSVRVLNRADGAKACCGRVMGERGLAGADTSAFVFWVAAHQELIMEACRRKHPAIPTFGLPRATVKGMVDAMKGLRKDLLRLGFGPFANWRQMTSGAHGIFSVLALCDSVSLYGFTTYPQSTKGGDQYAGNKVKMGSGWTWHDWLGGCVSLQTEQASLYDGTPTKAGWRLLQPTGPGFRWWMPCLFEIE